jgi:hypothetical protein
MTLWRTLARTAAAPTETEAAPAAAARQWPRLNQFTQKVANQT